MAVSGVNKDGSSANTQQGPFEQTQQFNDHSAPGYNPGNNSSVPSSIFDALARRRTITVPEALRTAIDHVTDHFKEKYSEHDVRCDQYQSEPSVFGWSIVGLDGRRHVALVGFSQLMTNDGSLAEPDSNKLARVYGHFDDTTTLVVENLVMTREDVENKMDVAIRAMDNAFIRVLNPAENETTISDLAGAITFEIRTRNNEEILEFVRNHSPTTVPPRHEFGFIAYARVPQEVYNRLSREKQEQVRTLGMVDGSGMPYMAVSAALDWQGPYQQANPQVPGHFSTKILPVITITQIVSSLQLPSDPILALVLADDVFINCEVWKTAARGESNPAPFFAKEENNPAAGRLDCSFDDLERRYPGMIESPVLALDVPIGRETNDFLYTFTNPGAVDQIVRVAERVLMDRNNTIRQGLGQLGDHYRGTFVKIGWEYQGIIRYRGVDTDSRVLTRLWAVKEGAGAQDVGLVERLTPFNDQPVIRQQAIDTICNGGRFHTLYNVYKMAVEPNFLRLLAQAFVSSNLVITNNENLTRINNLGMVNNTMFNGLGINPNGFSVFRSPFSNGFNGQTPTSWANPMSGFSGTFFG